MRSIKLAFLSAVAVSGMTLASASTLPVGTYNLSATTTTTGVHQSPDQGTLTGTLTFDASSDLTSADVIFHDVTSGLDFQYTSVGPTTISLPGHTVSATISNGSDASLYYEFSALIPGLANGNFTLSCGVDCDDYLEINDGAGLVYEEVTGTISPANVVPEPTSLLLLGTGFVGAVGAVRRRLWG